MDDIADPFSDEFKNSYTVKRGREGAAVELVRNQELARELYEAEIIGEDVMDWARGWWRDIAEAKRVYLREKYLEEQNSESD